MSHATAHRTAAATRPPKLPNNNEVLSSKPPWSWKPRRAHPLAENRATQVVRLRVWLGGLAKVTLRETASESRLHATSFTRRAEDTTCQFRWLTCRGTRVSSASGDHCPNRRRTPRTDAEQSTRVPWSESMTCLNVPSRANLSASPRRSPDPQAHSVPLVDWPEGGVHRLGAERNRIMKLVVEN